jgi:hypothetical protein
MEMANEISLVTIPVPHFWEYDSITSEEIAFRVYREDDWFKAVPQTSAEACKVSGLPAELVFVYANHVVLAANNMEEEAMNVIKNIILELQVLDLL